jgi:hypothetical protein
MRRTAHSHHRERLCKAAIACALALLLWPSSVAAEPGHCFDLPDLAEQGLETFLMSPAGEISSRTEASTPEPISEPCQGDAEADASSKFCFEDAEGPISTLPRLIAQWRGEQAAGAVTDSLLGDVAPRAESIDLALTEASSPEPTPPTEADACSTTLEECRALPPLPPTLVLEATPSAERERLYEVELLDHPTDDVRAWARLRVGPRLGYHTPPDRPPTT